MHLAHLRHCPLGTIAEEVTVESIKAAFKVQAMLLHPDRVAAEGGDAALVQQAHVQFQRLQIAYDALRDPEKRRAYDRGQLVH
jgi:DnaJ-class molecular chaperone